MMLIRLFFFLQFGFTAFYSIGQNCLPNIQVKVNICGSKFLKDSVCPSCYECKTRLFPSDSSFHIVSFVLTADGAGFEDGIQQVMNTGSTWNEARAIVSKIKSGSVLEFSCIKASYKDSPATYVLQPLYIELK
jgi:hypothetical protein